MPNGLSENTWEKESDSQKLNILKDGMCELRDEVKALNNNLVGTAKDPGIITVIFSRIRRVEWIVGILIVLSGAFSTAFMSRAAWAWAEKLFK